ncbi:MAG: hypothetical protein JWO15_124 [Sphingomonadales bacterium]|nr:hypothetical protein [Sphingomonadales bacterium]
MIKLSRIIAKLVRHRRGSTTTEFAIVALPLMMFITGGVEYGWRAFAMSVLNGEVDRAARTSETENASNTTIDTNLRTALNTFALPGNITITRSSYGDFSHIRPETLTYDANGNGKWNAGDCFIDSNGNGSWDADLGQSGQGGAQDVVLYTVVMTYPALTPISKVIGNNNTVSLTASTLVKNQPFAAQAGYNYQDTSTPICV